MADKSIPQSRPIVTRAEAIALGLKLYFTGNPCPKEHVAEREVRNSGCSICNRTAAKVGMRRCRDLEPELYRKRAKLWFEQRRGCESFRLQRVINEQKRRSRLKDAGSFTQEDIKRILKAQRYKCAECKISLQQGYQVDHIIPLSRDGSNLPRNIQLMCLGLCNQKKGSLDPVEFAQSVGRLL